MFLTASSKVFIGREKASDNSFSSPSSSQAAEKLPCTNQSINVQQWIIIIPFISLMARWKVRARDSFNLKSLTEGTINYCFHLRLIPGGPARLTLQKIANKIWRTDPCGSGSTALMVNQVFFITFKPSWLSGRSRRRWCRYPPAGSRRCIPPPSPAPRWWGHNPSPWTWV